MTGIWKRWMAVWCVVVILFGVLLALGGLELTAEPSRLLFDVLNGPEADVTLDATLRFSLGVMGAITIGWGITLFGAIQAAIKLGAEGRPTWIMITASAGVWYVIDSALSLATGFGFNVISNTVLLVAYLIPVLSTGVLKSH